ncbi:MAG: M23 family metallopeptidase [Cellvibrionaceae bacterium]|nr:M23 family metallopeptidase [Cellvibrionaceae bacterium]
MILYSACLFSEQGDLQVFGRFYPGAMLTAQAPVGATVTVFGRSVYLDPQGRFVFGLGRDAKGEVDIHVSTGPGAAKVYSFAVEPREYKIQRIEGVAKKYVSPPESVLARIRRDNASVAKARKVKTTAADFREGFIRPAKGPISGVYGSQRVFNGVPKRPHFGLDIAGPVGRKVLAPAAGTVTLTHPDMYYSGGTLLLDHGQGISSTFIHLSKILVATGQRVERGQVIAEIGATGRVTGPHLDWRVNWFDQRLDPQLLIESP